MFHYFKEMCHRFFAHENSLWTECAFNSVSTKRFVQFLELFDLKRLIVDYTGDTLEHFWIY